MAPFFALYERSRGSLLLRLSNGCRLGICGANDYCSAAHRYFQVRICWWDEALLKLLLGIFSVLFGLWGLFKPLRGKRLPAWVGRLSGGMAGFTSFIAHAGGPPLNFYLLQCQLTKQQFLGTAVVFLAITNLVKLVPYTLLGLVNIDTHRW